MVTSDELPMPRVKFMRAEVYGPEGWNPRPEKTLNPSWQQIEHAIRRLDRFQYPWIWLFLSEAETEPDEEELQECLTVMGGGGAYSLELNAGEHENLTLLYPDAPNETVEIWESDQGLTASLREVTSDIDLVLRIAKHFAETGQPLPEAPWSTRHAQQRASPKKLHPKYLPALHRSPACYALCFRLLASTAIYAVTMLYTGSYLWSAVGFILYTLYVARAVMTFIKARGRERARGALAKSLEPFRDILAGMDEE